MVEDHRGQQAVASVRTSHGTWLDDAQVVARSIAVASLRQRASLIVGLPEDYMEATQVLRYAPGQRYRPHMDAFDDDDGAALRRGGQRIATVVTWLSSVPQRCGGATSFPRAVDPENVAYAPRLGDSIVFYSVDRDAIVDPYSVHAGEPTTCMGAVKWIAVLSFHTRPFE
jgi:prolyl 4-hydroxylase